jgi:hypothetical protein
MANERNDALKDYVEVNVRIERFWQKFPNGRIETEVTLLPNTQPQEVIVKTNVYRDITDMVPAATGHAHEVHGSSYINRTSFTENCETSSIGRALAILGFEIKKSVASREEVANAQHQQQPKPQQPKPNNEKPLEHSSPYPSDAQLKMLNQKLMACGYTGDDKALVFKMIGEYLGYEIKQLLDIKKSDVTKLAEHLTKHKKAV